MSSIISDRHSTNTTANSPTAPHKHPPLSRRLLFPHLPSQEHLPPLFLSPDFAQDELSNELYDFIAISLRAYVHPWWSKLTRYDKQLLPHVTTLLTSVLRTLESRLTSTDLSPLVFLHIPSLVNQHIVDYRNACSKLHTSYASGGAASLPHLFHHLQSHMAISPDGFVDPEYIRQASDYLLKSSLPPQDYQADPERYIVREILVKVLHSGVIPRLTQPWFIYKLLLDFLGPAQAPDLPLEVDNAEPSDLNSQSPSHPRVPLRKSSHFSFQSIAIFVLSTVRSISGICLTLIHAYKQTLETIKKVNGSRALFAPPRTQGYPDLAGNEDNLEEPQQSSKLTFPGMLTPLSPDHLPPSPTLSKTPSRSSSTFSVPQPSQSPSPQSPDYTYPVLQLISTSLNPPPPLTCGSSSPDPPSPSTRFLRLTALSITHIFSMSITLLSPFLSRLLPYLLYAHFFSPGSLVGMARSAKGALFPDGWPAPPPIDPTPEEQTEIRQQLERRLEAMVPGPLSFLLGSDPTATAYTISSVLEPFSSQECNAHLLVMLLDLMLVTIFPEMGVVAENAMPNRGGDGRDDSSGQSLRRDLTPPQI